MMPFITEELYQKLSDFEEKKVSISIAPYPQYESEWSQKGTQVEAHIEYLMNVVRQIRSLSSSVNLPPTAKPEVYLVFVEGAERLEESRKLVDAQNEFILTLSKAKEVSLNIC